MGVLAPNTGLCAVISNANTKTEHQALTACQLQVHARECRNCTILETKQQSDALKATIISLEFDSNLPSNIVLVAADFLQSALTNFNTHPYHLPCKLTLANMRN